MIDFALLRCAHDQYVDRCAAAHCEMRDVVEACKTNLRLMQEELDEANARIDAAFKALEGG